MVVPLACSLVHRPRVALIALISLAVFAAACSGDGDATADDPSPTITVVMEDFSFTPAEIRVAEGSEVTIEARNVGSSEHSWVVLEEGAEIETLGEFDPERVVAEVHAEPGDVESVIFDAPAPGTYQVVCTITGHLATGMEGTLVVG